MVGCRGFVVSVHCSLCVGLTVMKTFQELPRSTRFYDPSSGEYWIKLDERRAVCDSGGSALEGEVDTFEATEEVELDVEGLS